MFSFKDILCMSKTRMNFIYMLSYKYRCLNICTYYDFALQTFIFLTKQGD